MKIKTRDEILNEIISKGKKHPKGWNAVLGKDNKRMSRDFYLFNKKIGVYLLKEYQKNPYQIKGIGGKIARHIDDDIHNQILKKTGDFGIIQGDFQKIIKNLESGIKPKRILDEAIKGDKDFGLTIPVRGYATESKKIFNNLHYNYNNNKVKIDNKFEEIASDEGLYNSYR